MTDVAVNPPPAAESPRFVKRLLRRRLALACLAYLAIVVLVAIVAPILLPDAAGQQAGDLALVRQGPSAEHLLGTDTLGRDVLTRLLVGTQVTILGVVEGLLVTALLGVPLGLLAGYFGGRVDRAVMWGADIFLSIPAIVVVLMVLSVFRQSMLAGMITFGVLVSPALMRVVRSAVLPIRNELYISAARVAGLSRTYILTRHVLPRVAGPIVVQLSLLGALALLVQTGLAFLGLLVEAPAPSWGGMVADGAKVIVLDPWLIWPPGIAIAASILVFGLLGDSVRDAMTEAWASPVARRRVSNSKAGESREDPERTGSEALLSIRGLAVSFRRPGGSAVQVVRDAELDIKHGEVLGVVGESGCGKSATAMAVLGLLPSGGAIDGGSILFEGRDLASLNENELHDIRGRGIGLVSQEPMVAFDPTYRVGWQIGEVVRCHHGSRMSRQAVKDYVLELLRQVNLPDPASVARRYPHELSGGMAQRVAIARALAGEPKLLIADEPTTALDVTVQAEILDLLRTLRAERRMAILLITHDWGVVADICDRAVVLYAGEVVEQAALGPIVAEPLHPYTRALLATNPQGRHTGRFLPTIPGTVPRPDEWPQGCHFRTRCDLSTPQCAAQPVELEEIGDERKTRCIHHHVLRK
ncbi:dipeptide/oligopeptide/nickel ABC transporter permease/ATP-binding protein [Amycolatopsis panacis]|uniref:ATP-binding cassette domain-containing protein n=1 Tax=Amycolatopsis panacis TaxID=2340917 RepID=A0A419I2I6_9PSEU|nr:dipeptide/oligopeptide/nickel ABC transporter permease/ATP-binding protein [Amycolatopsis panacis]RJQ84176.1 ATP-binding cassette domain-containing protein [Amycolatopsis panacis]